MPGKIKQIYTQGVYHIFNKTINNYPIFNFDNNCRQFLKTIKWYRSNKTPVSLSVLDRLPPDIQEQMIRDNQVKKYFKVKILAYCLMPTHYHLLVQQIDDNATQKFISDVINSFTRHINVLHDRLGPIFLTKYKSKPIIFDELLTHVSRYIHLNPYTSKLVKDIEGLDQYPWSSFKEYLSNHTDICDTKMVLSLFNKNKESYRKFVINNADYQRKLHLSTYTNKWI